MKRWIKFLLAADFFAILAMGMITPIYAVFVENIGGDILEASGAWALFSLTAGILMYLIARWSDKRKHYSKLLFTGYFVRSLAFLGYFFVSNTTQLFIVQIFIGVSFAASLPSFDAIYSKHLNQNKSASEWGLWESMNMIVSAFAAIIGGAIASFFGFPVLFMIMFLTGLIGSTVSLYLMVKENS